MQLHKYFAHFGALLICLAQLVMPVNASQKAIVSSERRAGELHTLRFMSYNVRFDSQPDSLSVHDSLHSLPSRSTSAPIYYANNTEQPWSLRRLYVANDIIFNHVDIFGKEDCW